MMKTDCCGYLSMGNELDPVRIRPELNIRIFICTSSGYSTTYIRNLLYAGYKFCQSVVMSVE